MQVIDPVSAVAQAQLVDQACYLGLTIYMRQGQKPLSARAFYIYAYICSPRGARAHRLTRYETTAPWWAPHATTCIGACNATSPPPRIRQRRWTTLLDEGTLQVEPLSWLYIVPSAFPNVKSCGKIITLHGTKIYVWSVSQIGLTDIPRKKHIRSILVFNIRPRVLRWSLQALKAFKDKNYSENIAKT